MYLSIIVISWNSLDRLKDCLDSISLCRKEEWEVIWVDNGSSDGSEDWVKENHPEVKRIILPENRGVAYARNRGVEASRGKYVWFVDDDTIPTEAAITAMTNHLDAAKGCGICAVQLRSSRGEVQESFKGFPSPWVKMKNVVRGMLKREGEKKTILPEGPVAHPLYVIGACQMIRRQVFDAVGLLDENIFYGPEDADFCLRAAAAGFTIDYLPGVSMVHHWRRMTRRNPFSRASRAHISALFHFWRKWGIFRVHRK